MRAGPKRSIENPLGAIDNWTAAINDRKNEPTVGVILSVEHFERILTDKEKGVVVHDIRRVLTVRRLNAVIQAAAKDGGADPSLVEPEWLKQKVEFVTWRTAGSGSGDQGTKEIRGKF